MQTSTPGNQYSELWQRVRCVAGLLPKLRLGPGWPQVPDEPLDQPPATEADPAGALVDRMLQQGRQALLLRPELAATMTWPQRRKAQQHLDDSMALLGPGRVQIANWQPVSGRVSTQQASRCETVEACWLDRLQVSNRQFHTFVAEGGYANASLWDAAALVRIGEFVDQTGTPGPRFWQAGQFPRGLEQHPVVGICWYEAAAFARWQGKRLPSDAEWINAACGSQTDADGTAEQRRYPWGHEANPQLANLWGSHLSGRGENATIATDGLPESATEDGIQQLLGNVWEWTTSRFQVCLDGEQAGLDRPLKCLRGGAFDTYFGDQAGGQLQSGECPFARKRNIGFRCAIDAADLLMPDDDDDK